MITFRLPRPGIRLFQPNKILALLWLFLLVFPKGGFKIAGVPITWGYLLLGIVSIFSLFPSHFSFRTQRLYAYLCTVPFQIISLLTFIIYGSEEIGFSISFIINFIVLPCFFYLFLAKNIETINQEFLFKLFKIGVFLIASYGIFLFAYKIITGKLIEIPFLTMNYHDLGKMESKCNDRGAVFKLISTYNNGNIYGICLLMIFPFYCVIETSTWKKSIAIISLFLSFSRTVWAGLVFNEILTLILITRKKDILFKLSTIAAASLGIIFISFHFGLDFSFLFDKSLGGRSNQFEVLETITLFPSKSFEGIPEIVYLGVLLNFGVAGLVSYLICMVSPIFHTFTTKEHRLIQKSIICGLLNYLFISLSDGALLYVPILIFYWLLSSLSFRNKWKNSENLLLNNQS